MNLNNYIPFREASIIYLGKSIPVLGINEFKIEIDRLQASYNVWVGASSGQSIANIDSRVANAINTTPSSDIDVDAFLKIDDFTISCKIKKYYYSHLKHAYCVSLFFILDRSKVKTYIYDKNNNDSEEQTRFDMLDMR